MRHTGSAQELEVRRRLAVRMLVAGKGVTEVAGYWSLPLVGGRHDLDRLVKCDQEEGTPDCTKSERDGSHGRNNPFYGVQSALMLNNFAERTMRHVIVGRWNWLFAGSDSGGKYGGHHLQPGRHL